MNKCNLEMKTIRNVWFLNSLTVELVGRKKHKKPTNPAEIIFKKSLKLYIQGRKPSVITTLRMILQNLWFRTKN